MLAFIEHLFTPHRIFNAAEELIAVLFFALLFFGLAYKLFYLYFEKLDDHLPHTPCGSAVAFTCMFLILVALCAFSYLYWYFISYLHVNI